MKPDEFQEARIDAAIEKLMADPELRMVMAASGEIIPKVVVVTFAIRDKGAGELHIPAKKYDAMALMALIDKYAGGNK